MSNEQINPESEPAEVESTGQDIDELSADQLKELIDNPQAEMPFVEPEPEPDVEQEAEAPESSSEVAEPGEETVTEEDRLSKLETMFQQAELRAEAEAARRSQVQYELDRATGELGHLKGQLQQKSAGTAAPQEQAYDYQPESVQQQPNVEPLLRTVRGEIDQMRIERTNTEATQELARAQAEAAPFWDSLGEERAEFEAAWNQKFGTELQEMGLTQAASAGDAKRARSIVRAAYKASLADSRLEWLNKTLKKNRTQPPSQANKNAKLAAASGASGSRRPVARPKPKTLDDMTADEIKAEIDRREAMGIRVD